MKLLLIMRSLFSISRLIVVCTILASSTLFSVSNIFAENSGSGLGSSSVCSTQTGSGSSLPCTTSSSSSKSVIAPNLTLSVAPFQSSFTPRWTAIATNPNSFAVYTTVTIDYTMDLSNIVVSNSACTISTALHTLSCPLLLPPSGSVSFFYDSHIDEICTITNRGILRFDQNQDSIITTTEALNIILSDNPATAPFDATTYLNTDLCEDETPSPTSSSSSVSSAQSSSVSSTQTSSQNTIPSSSVSSSAASSQSKIVPPTAILTAKAQRDYNKPIWEFDIFNTNPVPLQIIVDVDFSADTLDGYNNPTHCQKLAGKNVLRCDWLITTGSATESWKGHFLNNYDTTLAPGACQTTHRATIYWDQNGNGIIDPIEFNSNIVLSDDPKTPLVFDASTFVNYRCSSSSSVNSSSSTSSTNSSNNNNSSMSSANSSNSNTSTSTNNSGGGNNSNSSQSSNSSSGGANSSSSSSKSSSSSFSEQVLGYQSSASSKPTSSKSSVFSEKVLGYQDSNKLVTTGSNLTAIIIFASILTGLALVATSILRKNNH